MLCIGLNAALLAWQQERDAEYHTDRTLERLKRLRTRYMARTFSMRKPVNSLYAEQMVWIAKGCPDHGVSCADFKLWRWSS